MAIDDREGPPITPAGVMRLMAQVAIEELTEEVAKMADAAAKVCPAGLSGKAALLAFAAAIRAKNKSLYGKKTNETTQ